MSGIYIFDHCAKGLHVSCIRYGPPPNTVGGTRVVCGCSCHTGQDPCSPSACVTSDEFQTALDQSSS